MATGLTIQLGGIVWLYENYATMVYLLFFIPTLYALFRWHNSFQELLRQNDKPLLFSLIGLLFWVNISSLWSGPENLDIGRFLFVVKVNLLILIYISGVALLAKRYPEVIRLSVFTALLTTAIISCIVVVNNYLISGKEIDSIVRIEQVGIGNWTDDLNPVVGGIYFGAFTLIACFLFIDNKFNNIMKALIFICGILCLTYMLLTWTRSSLVGLGFVLFAVCLWKGKRQYCLLFAAFTFTVTIILLLSIPTTIKDYFLRGGFGSWRPQFWQAVLDKSLENLYFGTGINEELHLTAKRVVNGMLETKAVPHAHNFYLQLLYWCGLPGLALYLTMLARLFSVAYRAKADQYVTLAVAILSYFLIVQFFDVYSVFTRPHYYWPCIWFPVGILVGRCRLSLTLLEKIKTENNFCAL